MNRQWRGIGTYLMVLALVCMLLAFFDEQRQNSASYTYPQFTKAVEEDQIQSASIQPNQETPTGTVTYQLKDGTQKVTQILDTEKTSELLDDAGVAYDIAEVKQPGFFETYGTTLLLGGIMLFYIVMTMSRNSGGGNARMLDFGKSRAQMTAGDDVKKGFQDVAGLEEEKGELEEIVDFLRNPGRYTKVGARIPKGVLLVGPPGTGKTLIAKAVAGEAGVPFFSISGSDFVEMFVGVGASRVRDLFQEAKKHSPCIIFIDEIDAIGKSRDGRLGGGNDEREQTLNQLLAEMDGFDSHTACLVLGATNRPEVLDPALLRPGRFDRRIIVDRPDLKGRVDILKVHSKNVKMDETVDLDAIALATSGAVGSDLANMINEAAILAVKNGRKAVSQKDLFESVEVVLVGKEKKDRIMSKEERRIVSYHEVGHALVSALQKDAEPVQKITIVPRTMGALGYVMQVPEEEKYLNTKKEIDAMLVGLLAGRAAEEIVFDTVTTGAANDIEKATRLSHGHPVRHVREIRSHGSGSPGKRIPERSHCHELRRRHRSRGRYRSHEDPQKIL